MLVHVKKLNLFTWIDEDILASSRLTLASQIKTGAILTLFTISFVFLCSQIQYEVLYFFLELLGEIDIYKY